MVSAMAYHGERADSVHDPGTCCFGICYEIGKTRKGTYHFCPLESIGEELSILTFVAISTLWQSRGDMIAGCTVLHPVLRHLLPKRSVCFSLRRTMAATVTNFAIRLVCFKSENS